MPTAEYPTDEATFVGGLEDDDFTNGGHRTNFIPSLQAALAFAAYCLAIATEMEALGEQVETDAASAAAGSGTEASVANIRAVADVAHYISMRRIAAANVPVSLTDASSIAWDMGAGINFTVTIGAADRALANPTNQVAGKSGFINVVQDATGGRAITDYGDDFVWCGDEPVWPSDAGAVTKIAYFVRTVDSKVELSFAGNMAS